MAEVKWIKLSTGTFDSRKIRQIEKMKDGDAILIIWMKLLCMAGSINDGGRIYLTEEISYDNEMLSIELGKPLELVEKALCLFTKFGMISREKRSGHLILTNWGKYQNVEGMEQIRSQNAERARNYRARKKAQKDDDEASECDASRDASRDGNVTVTHRHAIEEDREEEIDKEIHHHLSMDSDLKKQSYLGGTLGRGLVMLSDEQLDSLLKTLSQDEFDHYVTVVADQISKGRYYKKSHYQAILDMAAADRRV